SSRLMRGLPPTTSCPPAGRCGGCDTARHFPTEQDSTSRLYWSAILHASFGPARCTRGVSMAKSACPTQEELLAFTLGEVQEDAITTLVIHLDACPECEARVDRLDALADTMLAELRRHLGSAANRGSTHESTAPFVKAAPPWPERSPEHLGDFR